MKKQLLIIGITLVLLAIGLSGCTDTQDDMLSGLGYVNEEYGFGLNPPEGWAVQDLSNDYSVFVYFLGPTEDDFQVNMFISNSTLDIGETLSGITEEFIETFSGDPNFTLILNNERIVNGMNAYEIKYTSNILKQNIVMVEKNKLILVIIYSALESTYDNYSSVFEESINSLVVK